MICRYVYKLRLCICIHIYRLLRGAVAAHWSVGPCRSSKICHNAPSPLSSPLHEGCPGHAMCVWRKGPGGGERAGERERERGGGGGGRERERESHRHDSQWSPSPCEGAGAQGEGTSERQALERGRHKSRGSSWLDPTPLHKHANLHPQSSNIGPQSSTLNRAPACASVPEEILGVDAGVCASQARAGILGGSDGCRV